jgi:hypothetical protein
MNRAGIHVLSFCALLFCSWRVIAQPGSQNFDKVWVQGQAYIFSTEFQASGPPINQIIASPPPDRYFSIGNSGICDSAGNSLLVCDGFNLYNKNLQLIDNGARLSPNRFINFNNGWSIYPQSSLILPFGNEIYRLITPTVSDDSCMKNWEGSKKVPYYDLLLYDEVDMRANSGAGRVTKRMVPLLQNKRLSKSQMMACRHGDGKSWWLFKHASDTNLIYKFLLTDNQIYGPYIQGFGGAASHFGNYDVLGQSMFSSDGTKYATTILTYSQVFVADFDRCTGMLSNPKMYRVPPQLKYPGYPEMDSTTGGLAFSPNGRYLYVAGMFNIHQLDLLNATSPSAWTHLSGIDTNLGQFQWYSNIYPGHDGKLYIGNLGGFAGHMSVIDAPDSAGNAAAFCRKCLRFPGVPFDTIIQFAGVSTPPCMPNYALGPTNPICYPTAIETPKATQAAFTLYPNPSNGTIQINNSEPGTLNVIDVQGRTISSHILFKASTGLSIDLGRMSPGIYHYRFQSNSGIVTTGKLLIAR